MPFITHPQSPSNLPVVPLWINGEAYPPSEDDSLFPVISSVQDIPIHYAVSASPKAAVLAVEAADTALVHWRKTTPEYRRILILKAADALERGGKEVMQAQMAETSCPEAFAQFNIQSTIWMREIASATTELRGVVAQNATGKGGEDVGGLTVTIREPVGVVMIIPP
jgi:acyl-CoA reductase-like NAD-dependent aldehyde dehydrogenase